MGNLYAPDIIYEYTVMRNERDVYIWALTDEWGQCDKICSGSRQLSFYNQSSDFKNVLNVLNTHMPLKYIIKKSKIMHLKTKTFAFAFIFILKKL